MYQVKNTKTRKYKVKPLEKDVMNNVIYATPIKNGKRTYYSITENGKKIKINNIVPVNPE